jgi:hypothetical protein
MVTPEAPKPMEPVMGLALAPGVARITAQNAVAPTTIGIVLILRFILFINFFCLSISSV